MGLVPQTTLQAAMMRQLFGWEGVRFGFITRKGGEDTLEMRRPSWAWLLDQLAIPDDLPCFLRHALALCAAPSVTPRA